LKKKNKNLKMYQFFEFFGVAESKKGGLIRIFEKHGGLITADRRDCLISDDGKKIAIKKGRFSFQ